MANPVQEQAGVQMLLDRAAIHDLHVRYFSAIDAGDQSEVRRCFATDVEARYHGRAPVYGIDALMGSIAIWPKHASGELKISTHFMGNLIFRRVDRDAAETELNQFSFLVLTNDPPEHVAMRCIRCLDRLRRVDGEWRISERLHTLDWSCKVPTDYATSIGQRIGTMAPG